MDLAYLFGMPGCANDINVLDASPLQTKIVSGTYPPPIEFTIAGVKRRIPYFMSDSIYPRWPCFLHSMSEPANLIQKLLAKCQEAFRKEVERALGVLQATFHIIAYPSRL